MENLLSKLINIYIFKEKSVCLICKALSNFCLCYKFIYFFRVLILMLVFKIIGIVNVKLGVLVNIGFVDGFL